MIRSYAGIWTQIGEPAFDDDLASSLRQAATMVRATGVLVIIASEPYNRRGEQSEGSLYPETTRRASTAGTRSFAPRWRRDRGTALFDLNCELGPDGHFTCDVDGAQVRSDGVHLSSDGLRWLAPWLAAQLQRVRS